MSPEERDELARLADEARAASEREYSQFVAAQDIRIRGVMAYPQGAPVPASNVERYGYLDHGLVITAEEAQSQRDAQAKAAAAAEQAVVDAHRAEVAAASEQPVSSIRYEDVPHDDQSTEQPAVKPEKKQPSK